MHSVTGDMVVEDLEKFGRNKTSSEVMSRRASPSECGRRGDICDGKKNVSEWHSTETSGTRPRKG
jgi:hypothetical protein